MAPTAPFERGREAGEVAPVERKAQQLTRYGATLPGGGLRQEVAGEEGDKRRPCPFC